LALADRLADRGFPESAKKRLAVGLILDPGSIDLRLKLGAVEIQLGHPDAARAIYEAILTDDPMNAVGIFNLGVVDFRAQQYDRAIERFEVVQGLQGPVDCLYYLGLIYQTKGDLTRAKFYFQKRWERRTSDEDAFAIKARELAVKLEDRKGE
jgi:tetratricopeptide (TPR) repeat protein